MKLFKIFSFLLLTPLAANASLGSAIAKLDYTPATPIKGTTYYATGILVDKNSLSSNNHKCDLNSMHFITSARLFKNLPLNTDNFKIQIPWKYDTSLLPHNSRYSTGAQDIKTARGFAKMNASLVEKAYFYNLAVLKIEKTKSLESINDTLVCIGLSNASSKTASAISTLGYGYYDLAPVSYSKKEDDIGLDGSILTNNAESQFLGMRVNDYENSYLQGPNTEISAATVKEFIEKVFNGENVNAKNGIEFLPNKDSFRFNIQQTGFSRKKFEYEFKEISLHEFERTLGKNRSIETSEDFPFRASKLRTSLLELENYKDSRTRGLLYIIEGKQVVTQQDLVSFSKSRTRPMKDFSDIVVAVVKNGKVVDLDLYGSKDSLANPIGNIRTGFKETLNAYQYDLSQAPDWVGKAMDQIKQSIDNIFINYIKNINASENQQLRALGPIVGREMANISNAVKPFYSVDAVGSQNLFLNVLSSLAQIDNHLRAVADQTGTRYKSFMSLRNELQQTRDMYLQQIQNQKNAGKQNAIPEKGRN